jgi:hypothetical protein
MKRSRVLLIAVGVAVLSVVALFDGVGPAAATSSRPAAVATTASDGQSFDIAVGEAVLVKLKGRPSAPWSAPAAADPSILRRQGVRRTHGDATARFVGLRAGRSEISATQTPSCPGKNPCQVFPRPPWRITVNVR